VWRNYFKRLGTNDRSGFRHETFLVRDGEYEVTRMAISGANSVGAHGITGPERVKTRRATTCHTQRPSTSPAGTPTRC